MRSPIRRKLLATFRPEFARRYPQFIALDLPPGSPNIWEWRVAENLVLFVMLQPVERKDVFAVEIAWSEDGEFPWRAVGDAFRLGAPGWRGCLGAPIAPGTPNAHWDLTPEVTAAIRASLEALDRGERTPHEPPPTVDVVLPRVTPAVDEALQKLRDYGLPVFKHVAEHRGLRDIQWPTGE